MWRGWCCFWRRMIRVRLRIRVMWWTGDGSEDELSALSCQLSAIVCETQNVRGGLGGRAKNSAEMCCAHAWLRNRRERAGHVACGDGGRFGGGAVGGVCAGAGAAG